MKKIFVLLALSVMFLSACSMSKKMLGLEKSAPDETKVETRDRLVLPPDFDELPEE